MKPEMLTHSGISFNLLNPGATNASQLQVGLNTATAGNFTGANAGTATINFVSDASNVGNCAPNCQLSIGNQTVNVSGKVYAPAVGQLNTPTLNFGILHLNQAVADKTIEVGNVVDRGTHGVEGLSVDLAQQLVDVGETLVEIPRVQRGPAAHRAHGHRTLALGAEQFEGRLDQQRATFGAAVGQWHTGPAGRTRHDGKRRPPSLDTGVSRNVGCRTCSCCHCPRSLWFPGCRIS